MSAKPTLLVVGLGMMGASLAAAAKQRDVAASVLGWARRTDSVEEALRLGYIDAGGDDLEALAEGADIAILAVPMSAVEALLPRFGAFIDRGGILSDVISVKERFIEIGRRVFGQLPPNLIPAHPLAGSERVGIEAADADLFVDRWTIFTPHETAAAQSVEKLRQFWLSLEAHVEEMDAARHDQIAAMVSHLPHMAAFALMGCADDEALRFAGSGFRDFSRIAMADASMWSEIARDNRAILSRVLRNYLDRLEAMASKLESDGDVACEELKTVFADAGARRRKLEAR